MVVPDWFGVREFYVVVVTVWFYIIGWIVVNYLRVKEVKLDVKRKVIGFKNWLVERRKRKELKLLGGGD